MNDKIKSILEKHGVIFTQRGTSYPQISMTANTTLLNNAIIEICEEQKKQSANVATILFVNTGGLKPTPIVDRKSITNSKNIAQ